MKVWAKAIGLAAVLCTLAACQPRSPVSSAQASEMAAVGTEDIVLSKQSGISIPADEYASSSLDAEVTKAAAHVSSSDDKRK